MINFNYFLQALDSHVKECLERDKTFVHWWHSRNSILHFRNRGAKWTLQLRHHPTWTYRQFFRCCISCFVLLMVLSIKLKLTAIDDDNNNENMQMKKLKRYKDKLGLSKRYYIISFPVDISCAPDLILYSSAKWAFSLYNLYTARPRRGSYGGRAQAMLLF